MNDYGVSNDYFMFPVPFLYSISLEVLLHGGKAESLGESYL